MARPIDEKIVRMTLDNARFKDNVKETLQSFAAINDATRNASSMDLSTIANGISAIERRFSATGVVVASIIKSITDSAIGMGKNLYAAMVDPIVEGGKKRALNIEQAKFQFEGLGMDVEKTMKSANDAVLGTAFGLDEAAVVASQFGATGMKAGDEMTEALRGISGVAAMTGSSYSDIGNIFTTVAGNGRLMGNDLLRLGARGVNAAATLGKAMGKSEQEIRKMVTAGEISFEDFAKAMSDAFGEHATKANETYVGSLSNLRSAFARIGAEIYTPRFEQLRDIFNALTPKVDALKAAIMPLIDAFNEMSGQSAEKLIEVINKIDFDKFVELGGISNIVKGFWNIVNMGRSILGAISSGFSRIFPGDLTTTLVSLTKGFESLTSKLTMSGKTSEKFATIFAGVFSIFSTVFEIAKVLAQAIFGIIPEGTGGGVLDFLVIIAEMAIAFNESVKEGNFLTEMIQGLGKVLGAVGEWLKTPIKHLIDFGRAIRENIGPAIDWLGGVLKPVAEWFKEAFSGFGMDELLGGGFLVAVALFLKKLSDFFKDASKSLDGITGAVKGVFNDLGGALQAFQEQVKYKNLLLIAVSIGLLAVSLKLLEGMSIGDIAKGIGALTGSMAILAGGMMAIEKMNFTGGFRASATIIALALATTIMASALKKISDLSLAEIGKGLLGLVGIVGMLSAAIIALSKWGGKIGTSSLALIALATSVTILASAVKKMSEIDTGSLFKAIGALGLIFAELALFLVIVKGSKLGPGTALALIGMAASIQIIVGAISKIAEIDVNGLIKGLVTIGLILAEITLFSKIAGGPQILVAGVGITMIAAALSMLMVPVTVMSKMSWTELAKGLGGMAVALLAVAAIGPMASGALLGAVGITAMALALNLLMPPILIFSAMSWTGMIKGFVGIAGGMAVMAGAALLLAPATVPMLGFGAALALMGAAVALAGIGIAAFGVGLTTLAGLTATSVAAIVSALGMLIRGFGTLIVDIVTVIVDLGVALIGGLKELVPPLIEVVFEIVSALVGGLIDYLAEMYPRAAEAFVSTIVKILQIIASHAQDFVEAGYDIPINILKGIQEKAPELLMVAAETMVALVVGMADAIAENRTPMVEAMVRLMGEVILVVIEAGVEMINALFGWLPGVEEATASIGDTAEEYIREHFGAGEVGAEKGTEFADGLTSTTGSVTDASVALASVGQKGAGSIDLTGTGQTFGNQFNTGFNSNNNTIMATGTNLANSGKSGAAVVDLMGTGKNFGNQFTTGLDSNTGKAKSAGTNVANSGKSGASSVSLTTTGNQFGNGFVTSVNSKTGSSSTAGKNLANSGKSGAGSVDMRTTGSNFGISFSNGIGSAYNSVVSKAKSLASAASNTVKNWLGIASPSKLLTGYGDNFGLSFANAIGKRVKTVGDKAKEMAVRASTALREYLDDLKPEEEEIRFKIVVDDDDFDPDDFDFDPIDIQPNPNYTNGLVATADDGFRQNRNNQPRNEEPTNTENHEYHYEINVTAGGSMSRAEVKKLAKDVQTEIKKTNDKGRIGRGEAVIF